MPVATTEKVAARFRHRQVRRLRRDARRRRRRIAPPAPQHIVDQDLGELVRSGLLVVVAAKSQDVSAGRQAYRDRSARAASLSWSVLRRRPARCSRSAPRRGATPSRLTSIWPNSSVSYRLFRQSLTERQRDRRCARKGEAALPAARHVRDVLAVDTGHLAPQTPRR